MKILKSENKRVFGIKYRLFTILKNTKTEKYLYYVNSIGSSKVGDCLIYKGNKKPLVLNKYTLYILGVLFTIFNYTLKWPVAIISVPFIMYFQGARNYITDSAWVNHVRFFNNVNIFIVIALILILLNLS